MTLRLGLLSTATINEQFATGAQLVDEVDVVAVASRERWRAERQAAELGIARAHGSYEDLLGDSEVNAVYISLPNALHLDWAVRALQAGKHVLCEKPLGCLPEEVAAAFDAADRAGRVLMEGMMWRHHPQVAQLIELLPEVGQLRGVRAHFSFSLPPEVLAAGQDIRLQSKLQGGALMDVGCYCVGGARLVAGEPLQVTAQAFDANGVDLRFAATLRFADGVLAHFDCAMDTIDRSALEVSGSHGAILLQDPWMAVEPSIELALSDGRTELAVERDDPYACQLRNFAAAADGDDAALLGREDAVNQARALQALGQSARTGRAITV